MLVLHRLLLCAQSSRLAQLIQAQAAAGNPAQAVGAECRWTLYLPDIYPDILGLMLLYMYCSLTTIPVDAAPLLFKAADRCARGTSYTPECWQPHGWVSLCHAASCPHRTQLTIIRLKLPSHVCMLLHRYCLPGLRAACLKVVVATIDLDNVCHNVLLAHDHKCSELSQVRCYFMPVVAHKCTDNASGTAGTRAPQAVPGTSKHMRPLDLPHMRAPAVLTTLQACILFVAASPERFQQVRCERCLAALQDVTSAMQTAVYSSVVSFCHCLTLCVACACWCIQVLATSGYLNLNQSHPRVGTAFVQACTQLLMA